MLDPSLLEQAYASALPGKEAVALNEALRLIIEALCTPQRSSPMRLHRRISGHLCGWETRLPSAPKVQWRPVLWKHSY